MTGRWFQALFLVTALLEIVSQIFNLVYLHWTTKPLLVIFLAGYYIKGAPAINKLFLLALIFCWLGDVFLMFDQRSELFFMAGLGSFLVAHLLLIFSYRQLVLPDDGVHNVQRVRLSFPIILAGTGLTAVLYPHLDDLKVPVMSYALVLTLMVLQSISRMGRTKAESFWLIFLGAVLFMVSDSLIAINKFFQQISLAGAWVMTTYIAAIYLLVVGVVAHEKAPG